MSYRDRMVRQKEYEIWCTERAINDAWTPYPISEVQDLLADLKGEMEVLIGTKV